MAAKQCILQNEVQTPAPHLCARHVCTFHTYTTIAQLAAVYPDDRIIREALAFFNILLDSEEGDFLKNKGFADALMGFISTITATVLPVDTEAKAVEVLFGVAAKLRLEPGLLPTWFRPNTRGGALSPQDQQASMDGGEFPLFYLTLDYVHHDGKSGDFARTGLLYLIEAAAHSASLEQWIIESDLATLMASGLGALYSQLSRKLVLDFDKESLPPAMTLSQSQRAATPLDADKTTSSDFKAHLTTFLSYLLFWQDVLEHCSSHDVKQSKEARFLEPVLTRELSYPSLIESSDTDGGSSVAVLTYLKCIIESIDHPDLVQLVFEYLLAIPEPRPEEKQPSRPAALARRRRSQSLLANLAQGQEQPLPDLFNLDDLVLGSLRSQNQQTVTATLQLISTMLRSHHQYDVSLIKMGLPATSMSIRPIHKHERNMAMLFSFIEDLVDDSSLGGSYNAHLEDAQNLLESHTCSMQLLALPDGFAHTYNASAGDAVIANSSTIASTDPVFASLVTLLHDFLANDIETNLSLTQVFSTISSCARRSLHGWLLDNMIEVPDDAPGNPMTEDVLTSCLQDGTITLGNGSTDETTMQKASRQSYATNHEGHQSTPVFTALDSLVKQVETFRQEVQNFDVYLLERKHAFRIGEDIDDAFKTDSCARQTSGDFGVGAHPPTKSAPQIGSISERLMSETSTITGSRSSSPRGRQPDAPSTPGLVRRLSHLRLSPSPSPSKCATRAISPSPLRGDTISGTPSRRVATPYAPPDALRQTIKVNVHSSAGKNIPGIRSETSSVRSESTIHEPAGAALYRDVPLSHLLTNVIILQEFMLELAAIVQVRASLFGEVSFDSPIHRL
ncbi:MAG: hypothetical protein Q9217_006004 [Psora testacea]